MSLLSRLFGKGQRDAATEVDRARQQSLHGKGYSQSDEEQQAARARMEGELDAQRDRRGPSKPTE